MKQRELNLKKTEQENNNVEIKEEKKMFFNII